jgi:hypothetical protein
VGQHRGKFGLVRICAPSWMRHRTRILRNVERTRRLRPGLPGDLVAIRNGRARVGEVHAWDALTPASGSAFRAGWTLGAGFETVLAPNWTFKLEYFYMDLGSAHLFDIVPGVPETVSFRDNIFRIGINYKFWDQPVRPLVTK